MAAQRKQRASTRQAPRYACSRDRDGVDDVFLIRDTAADQVIDSVPFWDTDPDWEARAEDEARQIVRELDLHGPRHVRAFDNLA